VEIWASPEPTFARISADATRDQLAETGHEARDGDIALLGSLGVRASRYPVLWEKCAPHAGVAPDFTWARRRLEALRDEGIEPVVTLVHHGSGPGYTSLVDPGFPEALAAYAGEAARAFPWVRRWTPINEPLTTARFSTLYGNWYPNGRDDDVAFGHAIVYEALGILLAMEAIRAHAPAAEHVLTEDLQNFTPVDTDPHTLATVAHQRERRYLSAELLMGRIVAGHPMHAYLTGTCAVAQALLDRIAAHASPPDVMGWNYYPNSERVFTAADGYVSDVPRVVVAPGSLSAERILRAAYDRLGLPFGFAEVHVNAGERGRIRWLAQRRDELARIAADGLPVRMLGVWAAFGLVDWDSLLLRREGYSEDGVFTFAAPDATPRETALTEAVRALAAGRAFDVPEELGWWETRGTPDGRLAPLGTAR
jgi:dTDP-4-dehydrorhamnose reductase